MQLSEGGNVFKDANGQPITGRINRADVKPTLAWLEQLLPGLDIQGNTLGSTGIKDTSGDLDIAVDSAQVTKEQLETQLGRWIQSQGLDPKQWIRRSGTAVHFLTPIAGDRDRGYVQTDFMFLKNVPWSKFVLGAMPADSQYKGRERNVLMNSIAKSLGYKLNQIAGIAKRDENSTVITSDPDAVAKMLLNPTASAKDLASVETIMRSLKMDPARESKIADFREHMAREGLPFDETTLEEAETHFLARLRDRIINQGMQPIFEARIEHPEDMVFDMGSRGIDSAVKILQTTEKTPQAITVKWDGKPAVIFGRKPTGEFVLTDKSGFDARGYDGLATSPEMMARIQRQRGGERSELIEIYNRLFPMLRAATPANFRGYIQADLMYAQKPKAVDGHYVFQPNTVQYSVPTDSDLGQQIANSEVALAAHTTIDQPGGTAKPIEKLELNTVPGLLFLDAKIGNQPTVTLDPQSLQHLKQLKTRYGQAIDRLFNPQELRSRKITDFPALCKQYINHRVRQGNFNNLIADFGPWLEAKTPTKYQRIVQWVIENKQGLAALFQAFVDISTLKMSLVRQLDAQNQAVQASVNNEPGHEGYVVPGAKFVDRMRFSRANFARNNPEIA